MPFKKSKYFILLLKNQKYIVVFKIKIYRMPSSAPPWSFFCCREQSKKGNKKRNR